MTEQERTQGCGTDVLVSFAESLQVNTGLLTVATLCGGLSGILAAVLLYVFCLKHLLLTREVSRNFSFITSHLDIPSLIVTIMCHQGYNARRLLEPDDGDNNQSARVNNRKDAQIGTTNDKVLLLFFYDYEVNTS